MTYYKTIHGKRYDRDLLEKADELIKGRGDGRISEQDAEEIFRTAGADGGIITTTEVRTLRYILDHYHLTERAHTWLWDQLKRQTPTQRAVQSILHEVFGLDDLHWVIDDAVVEDYENNFPGETSFPIALREMVDEFMNGMESSTSVRDIASLELGLNPEGGPEVNEQLRKLFHRATLRLFPPDYLDQIRNGSLDFKIPPFVHRVEEYWPFGLRLPMLKHYYFIGFVSRKYWWDTYHTGYK